MQKSFRTLFLAPLTVLVLAIFALALVDDAFGRGGARAGGGGGGGGAARAGGGGGGGRQVNSGARAGTAGGGSRQVNSGARAGTAGGGSRQVNSGARAGTAGGGSRQINSSQTDVRANNVRNSSVNNVNANRNTNVNANRNTNVNANRNVNVDVDSYGGCCGGGWDNDYHPVATAAAVTGAVAVTAAVVGSMVRTVPANCAPVNYGGMVYQQCGSTWYQPQGGQYVVINPPY